GIRGACEYRAGNDLGNGTVSDLVISGRFVSQRFRRWFAGADADQSATFVLHCAGENSGALAGNWLAGDADGTFAGRHVGIAASGILSAVHLPVIGNCLYEPDWRDRRRI